MRPVEILRKRYDAFLDRDDRQRAGSAPVAYPSVNTVMVDLLREAGHQPRYLWGVLHAARLAAFLGVPAISAVEFGVAGGDGLIALELASERAGAHYGVRIDSCGFDGGIGLPPPMDNRDTPNLFQAGDFRSDPERVRARLRRAKLVSGLVSKTVPAFLESEPAPIGFVSFDLDLYSSTKDALQMLRIDSRFLLPRVHCYFDDILGFTYAPFNGERLAIAEFDTDERKLAPILGLRHFVPKRFRGVPWAEQYYLCHVLDHPRYGDHDGLVIES